VGANLSQAVEKLDGDFSALNVSTTSRTCAINNKDTAVVSYKVFGYFWGFFHKGKDTLSVIGHFYFCAVGDE